MRACASPARNAPRVTLLKTSVRSLELNPVPACKCNICINIWQYIQRDWRECFFRIVNKTYGRQYLSSNRPPGWLTTCSQVPWPKPLWKFVQWVPNKGWKDALQRTPISAVRSALRETSAYSSSSAACLHCKFWSGSCKRGACGRSSSTHFPL